MSDYVTCQGTGNVMVYIEFYSVDTMIILFFMPLLHAFTFFCFWQMLYLCALFIPYFHSELSHYIYLLNMGCVLAYKLIIFSWC